MEMLINLTVEDNVTLVVVTHDESLAVHGDRTMIVKDGVIA